MEKKKVPIVESWLSFQRVADCQYTKKQPVVEKIEISNSMKQKIGHKSDVLKCLLEWQFL